jgi:hypothetical protein
VWVERKRIGNYEGVDEMPPMTFLTTTHSTIGPLFRANKKYSDGNSRLSMGYSGRFLVILLSNSAGAAARK